MAAGFVTWQVGINAHSQLHGLASDLSSFPRWVQKFFSPCPVVGLNLIQYSGVSLLTPKHRSSTYHATLNIVIILSINLLLKWFNIYLYKSKIKSFVCTLLRIVHFLRIFSFRTPDKPKHSYLNIYVCQSIWLCFYVLAWEKMCTVSNKPFFTVVYYMRKIKMVIFQKHNFVQNYGFYLVHFSKGHGYTLFDETIIVLYVPKRSALLYLQCQKHFYY